MPPSPSAELDERFRRVVERTFNCLSIDTDTSTSDTAVVLASGAAGPVDGDALEAALGAVAESLVKQIARDGEGAETLIEVVVDGARDRAQAKRVAKSIVNSPLVKTAVHGADPNWGRVAMAVGKCQDDTDIDQERVVIRFGEREVYPTAVDDAELGELSRYLAGDEVRIHVTLGTGDAACTVWGCDLTAATSASTPTTQPDPTRRAASHLGGRTFSHDHLGARRSRIREAPRPDARRVPFLRISLHP